MHLTSFEFIFLMLALIIFMGVAGYEGKKWEAENASFLDRKRIFCINHPKADLCR